MLFTMVTVAALKLTVYQINPAAINHNTAAVIKTEYLAATNFCSLADQHTIAIDSALAILASDGNGNYKRFTTMWTGKTSDFEISSALATLAVEISTGNRSPAIVNKYVELVKQIVNNPGRNLDVTGGLKCREEYGAYFGIALGWHQPDIKGIFSAIEQSRILATMKAGIVAGAFVMAKYGPDGVARSDQRVDIAGGINVYSSPNYAEGYVGPFLAGMAVIGKDNLMSFLKTYNHAAFLAELQTNGLTKIHDYFAKTFTVTVRGALYDASTTASKAVLIESYLQNIENNDALNKKFYRELKLSQIAADPVKLTSALTIFCYNNKATEGNFTSQLGMAQELDGGDASGVRSSLWYSSAGMINNLYSRYLVENYGYWAASTQTALKTQIDQLMHVGWADIASKSWNGYFSQKLGAQVYDRMKANWWQRTYDLAHSMGLAKEYYLHDNFQDANYSANPAWTAVSGSWTFVTTPTFTGITSKPDTVVKTNLTEPQSKLITNCAGDNYEVTVQCKINQFAKTDPQIGLIGRYNDANNYYLARYSNSTKKCEIIEVKNNVATVLATSPAITLNTGTVYFLRLSLNGNNIQFWINNVAQATVTNTSFTSGKMGLYAKFTDVMYDDVFVTKPSREN